MGEGYLLPSRGFPGPRYQNFSLSNAFGVSYIESPCAVEHRIRVRDVTHVQLGEVAVEKFGILRKNSPHKFACHSFSVDIPPRGVRENDETEGLGEEPDLGVVIA